ncbi:AAA family ATPase [Clostridium sp. FP2]|nr:AAA family ATPase [Clostridium sp. FP2]
MSGTGKSKIVELFAQAVATNRDNQRFQLVPVRPDWSDARELLGYRNIENKFVPGIIIDAAYEAMKNIDKPYFLCLDEMNLASVEYYFSDIL